MHIASLAGIERSRPMHGRLIVPDDQIVKPPIVHVDVLGRVKVGEQFGQDFVAHVGRELVNALGVMLGDIEDRAPRARVREAHGLVGDKFGPVGHDSDR